MKMMKMLMFDDISLTRHKGSNSDKLYMMKFRVECVRQIAGVLHLQHHCYVNYRSDIHVEMIYSGKFLFLMFLTSKSDSMVAWIEK